MKCDDCDGVGYDEYWVGPGVGDHERHTCATCKGSGLPPLTATDVAAYLLDRGDQYVTESASWIGLVDAAEAIMKGELHESIDHGELDDPALVRRALGMRT